MTKEQFLNELQNRLSFLPSSEVAPFISYYREMIEDRMEEGMSEADAVAGLGDIGRIVEVIQYEMPVTSLVVSSVKEKTNEAKAKAESRWPAWGKGLVIALLILGAPLWLSLLVAAGGVLAGLLAAVVGVIVAVVAVVVAPGRGQHRRHRRRLPGPVQGDRHRRGPDRRGPHRLRSHHPGLSAGRHRHQGRHPADQADLPLDQGPVREKGGLT